MSSFDKINVLWIEDSPLQQGIYVKDLIRRQPALADKFPKEVHEDKIPAIFFLGSLHKYHQYFDLRVLQHPIEIKDYIRMCMKLKNSMGAKAFPHKDGLLPDYVIMDYKLGSNITINQKDSISYNHKQEPIRRFINPNYLLIENYPEIFRNENFLLEDESNQNYSFMDFLKSISNVSSNSEINEQDIADLKHDDFGLFAGLTIIGIFNNNLTIGLPATYNKANKFNLTLHGKFFEWINESSHFLDFDRKSRNSKKWDDNLKDAARIFRKKVASYLELGKVIIQYSRLQDLADGKLGEDRIISMETSYGVKKYPIDGLFIDVPEETRTVEVQAWATDLLNIYSRQTGYDYNKFIIAKKAAISLIQGYQNSEMVENRIEFSKLVVQKAKNELQNKERLDQLSNLFGITEKEIDLYINGKNKGSDLTGSVVDFRNIKEKNGDDGQKVNRLIILLTDLLLHLLCQEFCNRNRESPADSRWMGQLREMPTLEDLKFALFPVSKSPLVLHYHYNSLPDDTTIKEPDGWDKVLRDLGLYKEGTYPNELSNGERMLCRNFALQIGLEKNYFPKWLIN
jgi:hypothetical protein